MTQKVNANSDGNQKLNHDGSAIVDIDVLRHISDDLGLDTFLGASPEGLRSTLIASIATDQIKNIVVSSGFLFGDKCILIEDAYDDLNLLLPKGSQVILRSPSNGQLWWAEITIGNYQKMVRVSANNLQKQPNHLKK